MLPICLRKLFTLHILLANAFLFFPKNKKFLQNYKFVENFVKLAL